MPHQTTLVCPVGDAAKPFVYSLSSPSSQVANRCRAASSTRLPPLAREKSSLSIRPFAPSDNFVPALTSAFTRVDDDLVFAGTKWGVASMPTYVSLINWTDQGIKNYKDSPSRAADFTKLAES